MKNKIEKIILEKLDVQHLENVHRNLPVERLIENEILNKEGMIGLRGAIMVDTGKYTGRSPKDKYIPTARNIC